MKLNERGESLFLLMAAVALLAIALAGAFRAGRLALEATRQARLRFAATEAAQNGLAQLRFKLATKAPLPAQGVFNADILGPYPELRATYKVEKKGAVQWIDVSASWGPNRKRHQVNLHSFAPEAP